MKLLGGVLFLVTLCQSSAQQYVNTVTVTPGLATALTCHVKNIEDGKEVSIFLKHRNNISIYHTLYIFMFVKTMSYQGFVYSNICLNSIHILGHLYILYEMYVIFASNADKK